MEENIEFGSIKNDQKLGTLTIKTANGNVKFDVCSGEDKVVDLSPYSEQQGSFMGNWDTYASIPSTVSGFTDKGYDAPENKSFLIVQHDETHGNQVSRYMYSGNGEYGKANWSYEFGIDTSISLSEEQNKALNSGITKEILADITERLGVVEQISHDDIIQPMVEAVSNEAQVRTQQVQSIENNIQGIRSQLNGMGTLSRYNVQLMTQSEYDRLDSRDASTFYFITDGTEEEDIEEL